MAQVMVALRSPRYPVEDKAGRGQVRFPFQTMAKAVTCVCLLSILLSLGLLELTSWLYHHIGHPSLQKQAQNKKPHSSALEASSGGQKKHNPQRPS